MNEEVKANGYGFVVGCVFMSPVALIIYVFATSFGTVLLFILYL